MSVLVTGTAGFVGSHVALRLLASGHQVIGLDNLSDYYDVRLKQARLARVSVHPGYTHVTADLADREAVERVFAQHRPRRVIHLAAQAGVRYAAEHPHVYVQSNLVGFLHVLEGCRHHNVGHLVFASTSSVYGANTRVPFSEHASTEHPLSFYAATKKANEGMAHSYAHLYGLPCTGLRFFTVYGPWGRPDMSPMLFADAIMQGRPIKVFNFGKHSRDFTYVDDIVEGVVRAMDHPAEPDPSWRGDAPDPATSSAPYRLYNIGNQQPVQLLDYIRIMERCLGRRAELELLPMQPGDMPDTMADVGDLERAVGYRPKVTIEEGLRRFADWYLEYKGLS